MLDRLRQFAQRTHLVRYLALYFSASFVALQVADLFADRLRLPDSVFTWTLVLAAAGLPLLLLVVVVHDRRSHRPHGDARPHPSHAWLTWRRVGVTVVGLFALWGLIAAGWLLIGPAEGSAGEAKPVMGTLLVDVPGDVEAVAQRATPLDSFAQQPLEKIAAASKVDLPVGEYLLLLKRAGYNDLTLLVAVQADSVVQVQPRWTNDDARTRNMVYVPARSNQPAFLIDKYEVTNAEYLEFVKAGGYNDAQLSGLVDRTGTPGPRYWSGGIYPQGGADLPVVGVSWREADAYARWRGKQLPTWDQWWHAALAEDRHLPWGSTVDSTGARANFRLQAPAKVGSHPLGVSHVGAHDMAGNVREWLRRGRNDPNMRIAVGGSWQDPTYLFDPQWIEEFPPGFANELIGFRCVIELKGTLR